jgi:hypothetical protein
VATWDDVRELALALPETEESTSYGWPAVKVRGRAFVSVSPHEPGALVLRCDPDERPLVLESEPSVFYVTPHYEAHAIVLARLDAVTREQLAERLEDSWLLRAPPALVARYAPPGG